MSDMNLVDYLLTQRKVERYWTFVPREWIAPSFLNFVPSCCRIVRRCRTSVMSVAKLHFISKCNQRQSWQYPLIEPKWANEENHLRSWYILFSTIYFYRDKIEKKEKIWLDSWLTRDSRLTWARAWLVQRYNSCVSTAVFCQLSYEDPWEEHNHLLWTISIWKCLWASFRGDVKTGYLDLTLFRTLSEWTGKVFFSCCPRSFSKSDTWSCLPFRI